MFFVLFIDRIKLAGVFCVQLSSSLKPRKAVMKLKIKVKLKIKRHQL